MCKLIIFVLDQSMKALQKHNSVQQTDVAMSFKSKKRIRNEHLETKIELSTIRRLIPHGELFEVKN